jgi:hypothetical protein
LNSDVTWVKWKLISIRWVKSNMQLARKLLWAYPMELIGELVK